MKTAWYRCSKCGLVLKREAVSLPYWVATYCSSRDKHARYYRLDPKRHAKLIREAKKMG